MGSFSNYLENKALDHVLGTTYTQPTIYVGYSTADPLDDGSGLAEPAGGNYSRKPVAAWNTAANRTTSNTNVVTFDQANGSQGTITHWAVFDNLTGSNMLAHGSLTVSKQIVAGNTPSIAAGEMDITINASAATGGWSTVLCNKVLDHIFGVASYTPPSIYLTFYTTTPTDAAAGTEPSGNNFARKSHSSWTAASGGAASNNGAITFNTPSGSWGTVTYMGAHSASSGGDYLFWGDVTDQAIGINDPVDFPSGDLNLTLS